MKRPTIEKYCLSALLRFPELYHESGLNENHFEGKKGKALFNAIQELAEDTAVRTVDGTIPMLLVSEKAGIGDSNVIVEVSRHDVSTMEQARRFFSDLRQTVAVEAMRVELQAVATADFDEESKLTSMIEAVDAIAKGYLDELDSSHMATLDELAKEFRIEKQAQEEGRLSVIKTGIDLIDSAMMGLRTGELTTLAGAGGIGKSTFALWIVRQCAANGMHCLVFSAEMSKTQVVEKIAHAESALTMQSDHQRKLSELEPGLQKIEEWGKYVHVYHRPRVTQREALAVGRKLVRQFGISLVVFDHLRKLEPNIKANGPYERVSAGIAQAKILAREIPAPLIMITHLHRGRAGQEEPSLELLRDSGHIEEESDNVLVLWPVPNNDFARELYLLKSRNTGYIGHTKLNFSSPTQDFSCDYFERFMT